MPDDPNLIGASVSIMGAVVVPEGVVDCFIQSYTSKPELFGGISLVDFFDVTKDRNDFIIAIRCQPSNILQNLLELHMKHLYMP